MPDQPDFLNAAVRVETDLAPLELLDACKEVEREHGSHAGPRHGPRPIDVDLLLVEDEVSIPSACSLPHPEVTSRRFVLVPLLELDPAGLRTALRCRTLAALPPGQRVERVGVLAAASE